MQRNLRVRFGFAALCLILSASSGRSAELCGRNVISLQSLHDELSRDRVIDPAGGNAQFVAFADRRTQTLWTFTKAGHPADPAVVCRRPLQRGDRIELEMQVRCGGPKAACDALVASFKGLNDRLRQDLRQ
jgi:hypothetical protein